MLVKRFCLILCRQALGLGLGTRNERLAVSWRPRLLHSPNMVVIGLSVGYETWPPIDWPFVISCFRYRLGMPSAPWRYGLTWPLGIPTVFQTRVTASFSSPNGRQLPSVKAVQGDRERVYPRPDLPVWRWGMPLLWRHVSVRASRIPGTPMFVKPLVQAYNKEISNCHITGHVWVESNGDWWSFWQTTRNMKAVSCCSRGSV